MVLSFIGSDVGEGFEVVGRSGGDRGTGNNVGGGVGDVRKREVLDSVKDGPDKLWRWGARRGSNRRGRAEGIGTGTWVVPGVEV